MFRALKIRQKLLIALLSMGIVPLLAAIWISSSDTAHSLMQRGYQELTSVREAKKLVLTDYFTERFADLAILANSVAHLQEHNHSSDEVGSDAHTFYKQFKELEQYHDLFLISSDGFVFYSVEREPDYKTSLKDGPYADSNLGDLYKKVLATNSQVIVDFKPYAPSNGNPAAFIGQPVTDDAGNLVMIVALQLSIDHLNEVMTERVGFADTEETYLVGPDKLMRSDSYLDPTNHSVVASFANPSEGRVDTDASRAALSGETDTRVLIDYNGNPVLSSFTPLQIKDITWALIAEVDEAEALAPVEEMKLHLLIEVGIALLLVIAVAYWLSHSLLKPIQEMSDHIEALSEGRGDLNKKLVIRNNDEIAELERRFNKFLDKIHTIVNNVSVSTRVIGEASSSVSNTVEKTKWGVSQQQEDSRAVNASLEELTASVQSIATSTSEARDATNEAYHEINQGMTVTETTVEVIEHLSEEVTQATEVIARLNEQSDAISKVLEVIHGIAEQTNLLALNAAIEAARAGDAGRGFSVVADEVRNLAVRTQSSTQQIHEIIDELQNQARHSVRVMNASKSTADKGVSQVKQTGEYFQRITAAISILTDMNNHIAQASEQQAAAAEGIYQRIAHMAEVADETESGTLEAGRVNKQLKELSDELDGLVHQFKVGA
ncbi:MAG: methyl-accepting chemotaxis protein [Gammaproteobacteria bacterium]|nr:MAG: methyl-accepting chemotaxis protein [Gammaproteobacteria bacterium]